LPTPVPLALVKEILRVASRAPSGTNTQPWRVHVLTGRSKAELSRRILAAYDDPQAASSYATPYAMYPSPWPSPYIERRRKLGWDLYGLLGLTRGNRVGIHAQHARNYKFFDAPVGMIFTIEAILERGSWIDYGMFLQNIMIAAQARGLGTCPQESFAQFDRLIAEWLALPKGEIVLCGMSLGHPDPTKIENSLATERESVDSFAQFRD
jgi:nitroreductase